MKMPPSRLPVFAALIFAVVLAGPAFGQAPATAPGSPQNPGPAPAQADAQRARRLEWWQQAKFGMFIHWGIYSLAGGEWKGATNHAEWLQFTAKIPIPEYTAFARTFDPVKFDADAWVSLARDAGMKYLVVTAKHHDGFAMFDSPSDPFNIVKLTGFGRDPVKELSDACRKYGLRFCVYYSLGRDWHDPDASTTYPVKGGRSNTWDFPDEDAKVFSRYLDRKVKPQVRELLTQYGPLGILWFDTPEGTTRAESVELEKMIHGLQPDCIINDRIGNALGDYKTAEQKILAGVNPHPWETNMTMSAHWGFNKADHDWKSAETLIRNLVDIVSKGGNYLLNVGPTGEGVFPAEVIERLRAIGGWMKTNGESIYGCGATPFGPELGSISATAKDKAGQPLFVPEWQWRCTTKGSTMFLHLFAWPTDGKFVLSSVKGDTTKVYLLDDPMRKPLEFQQSGRQLTIDLPPQAPDSIDSVLCVEASEAVVESHASP